MLPNHSSSGPQMAKAMNLRSPNLELSTQTYYRVLICIPTFRMFSEMLQIGVKEHCCSVPFICSAALRGHKTQVAIILLTNRPYRSENTRKKTNKKKATPKKKKKKNLILAFGRRRRVGVRLGLRVDGARALGEDPGPGEQKP